MRTHSTDSQERYALDIDSWTEPNYAVCVIVKFIEATSNRFNWGKFMLARFEDAEWQYKSAEPEATISHGGPLGLLHAVGWNPNQLWVFDLQTCEGAAFTLGGNVKSDLDKHRVWVCPLFEPFLEWLYQQDVSDLSKLPALVDLPDAENAMSGYRRPGPGPAPSPALTDWKRFAKWYLHKMTPEEEAVYKRDFETTTGFEFPNIEKG